MRGAKSGDVPRAGAPHGPRRLAGGRLAEGSTAGRGVTGTEQLIFFGEANIAGAPLFFVTISHRRPGADGASAPRCRRRFCRASPPARSCSRSAIPDPRRLRPGDAEDQRRASRRRPLRRQRQQAVDLGHRAADFIWLAAPHRPGTGRHLGISLLIVDAKVPGVARPDRDRGQRDRGHLLRQRAGARRHAGGRGCTAAGS